MIEWLSELRKLQEGGSPSILVTVAETRGSAPREAGAKMVVTENAAFGTIGGGQLEYEALRVAREMLAGDMPDSAAQLHRFNLGPSLGQCCGGSARVLFEPVSAQPQPWQAALRDLVERREQSVLVTAIGDKAGKLVVSAEGAIGTLRDPQRQAEAEQAAGAMLEAMNAGARLDDDEHGGALLLEPIRPERLDVVLFGAGHVGRALVRVLGELPCRIAWIDGRIEQFPREVPANVCIECTAMPQYAVERAPSGAAFLVMTHSHALDFTLCEKILRRDDFSYLGLIGSATKRAKFIKRFRARGVSDGLIGRMVCPIGLPGLSGKHPGEIAVAVAAQLLMLRAASIEGQGDANGRDRANAGT